MLMRTHIPYIYNTYHHAAGNAVVDGGLVHLGGKDLREPEIHPLKPPRVAHARRQQRQPQRPVGRIDPVGWILLMVGVVDGG